MNNRERFLYLRRKVGRLQGSNYDITNKCNLKCEGCLYFSGEDYLNHQEVMDDSLWDAFFSNEAGRGVNFAYIAGGEPSIVKSRLRIAARHIKNGIIFTNGTRKIDTDIPYRIHLSLWGKEETSAKYRGANLNAKALKNYAGDKRAVAVMTVNAMNIGEIEQVVKDCAEYDLAITFNYFSATTEYIESLRKTHPSDNNFFRISSAENNLMHTPESLNETRAEIVRAMEKHPNIIYSMHYDNWITQTPLPYQLDEKGIAVNCGNRLSRDFRHLSVDHHRSEGKCCSPNIDCSDCRAYAQGYATFLKDLPGRDPSILHKWLDVWEVWIKLFMPTGLIEAKS